jgi:hypothetical protein
MSDVKVLNSTKGQISKSKCQMNVKEQILRSFWNFEFGFDLSFEL